MKNDPSRYIIIKKLIKTMNKTINQKKLISIKRENTLRKNYQKKIVMKLISLLSIENYLIN